jgi:hypothetical protein
MSDREAFEHWYADHTGDAHIRKYCDSTGRYQFNAMQSSWEAWQAAQARYAGIGEVENYAIVEQDLGCLTYEVHAYAELTEGQKLYTHPPAQVPDHSDDIAVDKFAAAMKEKMAKSRAKGRSGWDDPLQCSGGDLASMLVQHIKKGDPVDVANFCMMLHQRGISGYEMQAALSDYVAQAAQPQVPQGWEIVRADSRHISVKHPDGTWTTIQDSGPLNNLMFYELCLSLTASQEQEGE